jgi:hypothetical protein
MATPDFQSIGTALVTQWLTVEGVRSATRRALDSVPNGSHVVVRGDVRVEPDMGPLAGRGAGFESMLQRWTCVLYVAPYSHTGTAVDTTLGLVANAYVAWRTGLRLGLGGVVQDSYIAGVQITETLDVPKSATQYVGAIFEVIVRTRANVTRTA